MLGGCVQHSRFCGLQEGQESRLWDLDLMPTPDALMGTNLPDLLSLARTLVRSRSEAITALATAGLLTWAILQLTGLLQLAAVWLTAELIFFGYQRFRCDIKAHRWHTGKLQASVLVKLKWCTHQACRVAPA